MGRTLGEMTPEERRAVTRRAAAALQDELQRAAPAIARALDEADREAGEGYTAGQLSAAFDLVKNRGNWKLPIDAVVPASADTRLIADACLHYAGSPVDFQPVKGGLRVTGAGYYACIGS
jgi:hypothetical protein